VAPIHRLNLAEALCRPGCRDGADREAEQGRDHETAKGLPH
jgi:hypothetical protein